MDYGQCAVHLLNSDFGRNGALRHFLCFEKNEAMKMKSNTSVSILNIDIPKTLEINPGNVECDQQ
jgi:hypothetical protein